MAATAKDPTQDVSNLLFLHHSDGPGLVLTSQPLDNRNYTTRSKAMRVALSVKNKLAFIDGTLSKPAENDPTFFAWTRANNVVISWLYNSVSKDIIISILFASTAKEIWDNLKTIFSRKNSPRIFKLRRQLMSLQQGMNDSFSQVRGQILLYDPLPSIGNVFSLVLQEEAQREIVVIPSPTTANSNPLAFVVNSSQSSTTRSKFSKKERPRCAHCDMLGHTKDKCYKLVGYPPNYFKNRPINTVNQVVEDSSNNSNCSQHSPLITAQCQQLLTYLTNQM
ncbi:Gag-polypeptide of LTR copia-type [Sesbania bispinosa]|nr:Gag-polypeptide of LTR copia-type [Sesbania bispinosa]